jgi:hypothetical protein
MKGTPSRRLMRAASGRPRADSALAAEPSTTTPPFVNLLPARVLDSRTMAASSSTLPPVPGPRPITLTRPLMVRLHPLGVASSSGGRARPLSHAVPG